MHARTHTNTNTYKHSDTHTHAHIHHTLNVAYRSQKGEAGQGREVAFGGCQPEKNAVAGCSAEQAHVQRTGDVLRVPHARSSCHYPFASVTNAQCYSSKCDLAPPSSETTKLGVARTVHHV